MSLAELLLILLCAPAAAGADGLAEVVVVPELPELRPPTAGEQAEAEAAYARSAELYEAGDQAGALAAAERLYSIMPNASTALVRGQLLTGAGRPCAAFAALAVALDMDPTEEERSSIVSALEQNGRACKPGAAWATLKVVPEEARVRIAGRDVPAGRTVVIEAGVHAVEVEAPGYARLRASVKADPGEEVPASFETERLLQPAPVATPAAPAKDPVQPEPDEGPTGVARRAAEAPSKTLPWLLTGGGAALAVAGAGIHVWAADAASEAQGYLEPRDDMTDEERRQAHDDASSSASARATTAYVLYGAGAVALGAGIYWLLTTPDGESASSFGPVPWVLPGGVGLSFAGRL